MARYPTPQARKKLEATSWLPFVFPFPEEVIALGRRLLFTKRHTRPLTLSTANSRGWRAAQSADPEFISTYARDNRNREDIAESFLVFLAVRHREERISNSLIKTITDAIPNRIAYFDELTFDWYPILLPEKPPLVVTATSFDLASNEVGLEWNSQPEEHFMVESSQNLTDWKESAQVDASEGATTRFALELPKVNARVIYLRVRKATTDD